MNNKCPQFDLMNPMSFKNGVPFDDFKALRQQCPVSNQEDTVNGEKYWAITKREDLDFVSKKPNVFSTHEKLAYIYEGHDEVSLEMQRKMIINMDPPEHLKYRRIVKNAFNSTAIDALEPFLRETAKTIIDKVAAKGSCEFVSEVSAEMPLFVICAVMGMLAEKRQDFSHNVDIMLSIDDPEAGCTREKALESQTKIFEIAMELAEEHRQNPKDNVVAALLDGVVEGESLTVEEFCAFFLLLIVGGIETTRTATSNGMHLLIEHPEQLQKLVDDPSLIPGAVEEILRYNPSFMNMRRTATEDVQVGDMQIKKGDKVILYYSSVNHDEDIFGEDSDIFDVTRAQRKAELRNEHRAFGVGQHFCLGTHLARMEMTVMFEQIIPRLRNPKLLDEPKHMLSAFISGIMQMNISFDPE